MACCGSFLPIFVDQLPNKLDLIDDNYVKSLNKVLKVVVKGTRLIMRQATDLLQGGTAINWRQTAITSFYKPKDKKKVTRKVIDWSDNILSAKAKVRSKSLKNKTDPSITLKNKNLRIDQIFSCNDSSGMVYWEFKAG